MLDFSVQQLLCQRDRRDALMSQPRNVVPQPQQSTILHGKQECWKSLFANESILDWKYHPFPQQSCSGLPGRTWSRCSSATHGWFAPHRRHLGFLGAAVQVGELLQLGLSDLIIVILHTAKPCVHRSAHADGSRHAFNYTVLNSSLCLRGYSPGNI